MNCQEIPLIKNFIIQTFDTSQTLKQAISSTRDDFKEDVVPSIYDLLNNNLFPYKYPRTLENVQKTIVSISVSLNANPRVRDGSISIYVYTHVDLANTVYDMIRLDYINCRIEELLNNADAKGIMSSLNFVSVRELPPVKDWIVSVIDYKFEGLNDNCVQTEYQYG